MLFIYGFIGSLISFCGQIVNTIFISCLEIKIFAIYSSLRRLPLLLISFLMYHETINIYIWISIIIQILSFIIDIIWSLIK